MSRGWGLIGLALLMVAGISLGRVFAAQNALMDLTLNNERGPLSILLKFQTAPKDSILKSEDRSTWVLTLPSTDLIFQKGRYHRITVGGLGVKEIEIMPVEKDGDHLVRLEIQVQEGFSVVDRTSEKDVDMRLEILPLPGKKTLLPEEAVREEVLSPPALLEEKKPLPPPVPIAPVVVNEAGVPAALPPRIRVSSAPESAPLPLLGGEGLAEKPRGTGLGVQGLKSIPFAEELLLGTDAKQSGPERVGEIESRLLATRVSNLAFRQAELADVLSLLALKGRFNMVVAPDVSGQVTLTLNHVSVKEALDVLSRLSGISYKVFENTVLVAKAASDEGIEPLETEIIELNYSSPENVKAIITGLKLLKRGVIEILPGNKAVDASGERIDSVTGNVLMVRETKENIRLIREVCRKVDRKPRQVHVAVRFVEMETEGVERRINRFAVLRGGVKPQGQSGLFADDDSTFFAPIQSAFNVTLNTQDIAGDIFKYGIVGSHKGFNFAALLKQLIQERLLEVVASPNLLTLDGKQGQVDITDKVTFFETGTISDGGGTTTTRRTVDFGVKMKVTPRIDSEGAITMFVEPEVITPGPERNGVPEEKTKTVKLTVRVKSGETLVLGGLINNKDEEILLKMPLLGDLPVLKKLFRNRKRDSVKKELAIFVTPRILEEE